MHFLCHSFSVFIFFPCRPIQTISSADYEQKLPDFYLSGFFIQSRDHWSHNYSTVVARRPECFNNGKNIFGDFGDARLDFTAPEALYVTQDWLQNSKAAFPEFSVHGFESQDQV
jgi:hypothetical protein